jgi:hypothetical protein
VLAYEDALWHGFDVVKTKGRPITTPLADELARIIKGSDIGVRRVSGTKLARADGKVETTAGKRGNSPAHRAIAVRPLDLEEPTPCRRAPGDRRPALPDARLQASVRGVWHFNRVDLEGRVTAQSPVWDLNFVSVSGFGSVTWRVIDDLSFSLSGEISYRNVLLNEPKDFTQLHPLEQFYGGGAYGDVTFWSSLSVQYVFGNSVLNRQDQRWR